MADLGEAFNVLKFQKKAFQNIDYFFTQRTLIEETEYIDKNMNRMIKKIKVTHNFLALNIPLNLSEIQTKLPSLSSTDKIETENNSTSKVQLDTNQLSNDNNNQIDLSDRIDDHRLEVNKLYKSTEELIHNKSIILNETPIGFDVEIFGDAGYHYKGTITSYAGFVPNFMIPIKGDKKIFVNINYKFLDENNKYIYKKYVSFIEVPKRFQMNPDNDQKNL